MDVQGLIVVVLADFVNLSKPRGRPHSATIRIFGLLEGLRAHINNEFCLGIAHLDKNLNATAIVGDFATCRPH